MASQLDVVDAGDAAPTLSEAAARRITRQINESVGKLEQLVLDAYRGKVWTALGHDSWDAYVLKELDMSRTNSYRLINQAEAINAITAVTPTKHARLIAGAISQRSAMDLKRDLPASVAEIAAAVETGTPVTVAVKEAVARRQQAAAGRRVLAVVSRPVEDDDEPEADVDLMAVAATLDRQLRDTFAELQGYIRSAPKPKDMPADPEALWDFMGQWLYALAPFTSKACQDRLFEVQADVYRILLRAGGRGSKEAIAEMVGLTTEGVDYLRKTKQSAFPGL